MDTGTSSKDTPVPETGGAGVWADQLLAACRMLRSVRNRTITAVSVTLPRANEPDNLAEVELLSTGLARFYDLDVTVEPHGSMVSVRLKERAP